jgi:poly-gamma-glutamate synthesis protein (capsule biosynthesis protein)
MALGFNIINIANNHMLDMGETGYVNQLDYWDAQNALYIGGYRNREDFENIRIFKKDGISIAWVAFTYGLNGMTLDPGSQMFVPLISDDHIRQQMQRAKAAGADLVFASMHWGPEDVFSASAEQRRLAQILVDAGADAIIGHHPHVLQEVRWVERVNYPGGGKTLIAYSLGNLISTQHPLINMIGGLLQFDIVKNAAGDTVIIENPLLIPVITHYITPDFANRPMERRGLQVYVLEDYTSDLLARHGTHYRTDFNNARAQTVGRELTLDLVKSLVTDHVDPDFLSDFYKR